MSEQKKRKVHTAEFKAKENRVAISSPGYMGYVEDISFRKISEKIMAIQLDIEMNGMGGGVKRGVFSFS